MIEERLLRLNCWVDIDRHYPYSLMLAPDCSGVSFAFAEVSQKHAD